VDTAAWEVVGCAEGSGLEERVRPAGWCVEQFADVVEEEGQSIEGGQSPDGGVFGGMRPDQRRPSLYQRTRLGHAPEVQLNLSKRPASQHESGFLGARRLHCWTEGCRGSGGKSALSAAIRGTRSRHHYRQSSVRG